MKNIKLSRKRIYEVIEKGSENDKISNFFDITILILVILSILQIVLESHTDIQSKYGNYFRIFEFFTVILFTVEYLMRIYTAKCKYKKGNLISILKFIFSFEGIIDLIAILPFYLPLAVKLDLRFVRVFKVSKVLRIFKLGRYSKSFETIKRVLKREKEVLVITLMFSFLLILVSSILMYYVENPVQPQAFPNITATMWWGISTLTTIGYGDIYPVTALGKVLASVVAIVGIGIIAIPTGIISAGFVGEIKKEEIEN